MLYFPESRISDARRVNGDSAEAEGKADFVDLDRLLAMIRRQIWMILLGVVVGIGIGVLYLLTAVPLFTASTDILIDKKQSQGLDESTQVTTPFQEDAEMLSRVELLKSEQIAKAVIQQLKLTENENFMVGSPSVLSLAIGSVRQMIGSLLTTLPPEAVDDSPEETAVLNLQTNLNVARVGQTYVLNLTYTSHDPALSAAIANAYGDAYLSDQLQAKYDATKRASGWLQDRIAELRQQAYDADLAVQKFRNANGLIASGDTLVSQQQLSEINTQLVTAQADAVEAKARVDQIRSILASGRTDGVVNEALASQTTNDLRAKYLDASRRETEIRQKLGANHVQAVRLRAEMREYERLIFGELKRIAESYESNYAVALQRQESLEKSLAAAVNVNAGTNTTQVDLRQLEREAATFKSLYDNFLERYQQTVQQQSFPITDARVISPAVEPERPSSPKKALSMALFLVLGAAGGAAVGGFREYRDRFFRVGKQVHSELDTEFLGYVPLVDPNPKGSPSGELTALSLWPASSMADYVRRHPLSAFAETLRNVKVAADLALPDKPSKIIGIVSCLPSEGKSTLSSNFGCLLAMQGAKTLLIDGDLRNPGLTRTLNRRPDAGTVETILGSVDERAAFLKDCDNLALLPTILKRRVVNTSELLTSQRMADLLTELRQEYEYIVVDLPPLGPVVDAKAFASRVDAFVVVLEWGKTSRQLARNLVAMNSVIHDKCLGVILNKTDTNRMKLYRAYGSPEYYAAGYKSYYQS